MADLRGGPGGPPDDALPGRVPLSRVISLAKIGGGETVDVAATQVECAAIARQLQIPQVGALQGRFVLETERQTRIPVTLHLRASVTQTCVVSLETFEASIDEAVKLIFVPAESMTSSDDDPESPDEIPFDGVAIDLGVALTEQLALSLDPYPRRPEVVLPEAAQSAPANPFASFFRQTRIMRDEPDD